MMADDLISTRQAAQLYGCTECHLLMALRAAGIPPVVELVQTNSNLRHRRHFWRPSDVLRVRAERKLRQTEARLRFALMSQSGTRTPLSVGSRLKARQTRLETYRQKLLTRIAERTRVPNR